MKITPGRETGDLRCGGSVSGACSLRLGLDGPDGAGQPGKRVHGIEDIWHGRHPRKTRERHPEK